MNKWRGKISTPEVIAAIIGAIATIMAALIIIFPQLRPWGKSSSSKPTIQELQKQKELPPESPVQIQSVRGIILTPHDGNSVLRTFNAEGTIVGLPHNSYLWLAVEHSNLSWPKGPIKITGTSWSGRVYEGGSPPSGYFSLSLYMVDSNGHQKIINWLRSGEKSGYYPGFSEVVGGQLLH